MGWPLWLRSSIFGSGFFIFLYTPIFIAFLQEAVMISHERVAGRMMLFLIKDWDSFQRVMRLWRKGWV